MALTTAAVAVLVAGWLRTRSRPLPAHGWLGLVLLAVAEWLLFRGVEPVATYFTPIAWTAWILLADAALFAVRGRSPLRDDAREIGLMALLSIPLWLVFEAYNLRLANWRYTGLPESWPARWLGYAWSFASITPAILLTAELIEALGWPAARSPAETAPPARPALSPRAEAAMLAGGALCLSAPLFVPRGVAAYLFAPVWIGFFLLLDPVNARLGLPSIVADLAAGDRRRLLSLLASGWVCGWLWEFWNYWAAAKWVYVFPMFQQWKIFEMPAPGFLGFPPFALECFAMYTLARGAISRVGRSGSGARG